MQREVCFQKNQIDGVNREETKTRPFLSSPGPLFQNEARCSAIDMEIIFHSHANKTHFHKKGCAPSEGFWNSKVSYSVSLEQENCSLEEKMV